MTTRLTLVTRARTELQESSDGFWSTVNELNLWADEAHAELVVATRQETSSALTLVGGTESYSLPTDFYLARRVELQSTVGSPTNWFEVPIYSMDFRRPGDPLSSATFTSVPIRCYIYGGKIVFVPVPDLAYSGTLYYYKNATAFSGDSDAPSYPEGIVPARFDAAIVDYVVAKALTKRQDNAYLTYAQRYNAALASMTHDAERRGAEAPLIVRNDWMDE